MDNLLKRFNDDKSTKEAFYNFIVEAISQKTVELAFERKDTSHIADAKMLIDDAFERLKILYAVEQPKPTKENRSR